jgi:hypothetical protein
VVGAIAARASAAACTAIPTSSRCVVFRRRSVYSCMENCFGFGRMASLCLWKKEQEPRSGLLWSDNFEFNTTQQPSTGLSNDNVVIFSSKHSDIVIVHFLLLPATRKVWN